MNIIHGALLLRCVGHAGMLPCSLDEWLFVWWCVWCIEAIRVCCYGVGANDRGWSYMVFVICRPCSSCALDALHRYRRWRSVFVCDGIATLHCVSFCHDHCVDTHQTDSDSLDYFILIWSFVLMMNEAWILNRCPLWWKLKGLAKKSMIFWRIIWRFCGRERERESLMLVALAISLVQWNWMPSIYLLTNVKMFR